MSVEYTRDETEVLSLNGSSLALAPLQVGQQLILQPRNSAGYNLTWRHGNLMLNTNAYIRGSVLDVEPNDGLGACDLGLPCLFSDKGYVRDGRRVLLPPAARAWKYTAGSTICWIRNTRKSWGTHRCRSTSLPG